MFTSYHKLRGACTIIYQSGSHVHPTTTTMVSTYHRGRPGPGAGREGQPPWARQTWGPRMDLQWEGLVAYAPEEKLATVRTGGPFSWRIADGRACGRK
jgi:hypothetical protein